ncbi:hypothetical protein SAMN02910384_02514 [Pseudobutyrivibrio sp. ACV-2]|uniref:hypothetical protein n=1 Tax=Pseudobutyrivibrio sp. ACV-2 TaxID=1520801 RepID=UPI0008989792|nr:hypothetical protein [Pseudobutyrivibrio sp. ACV-2]SEA85042.1 hypothetical protein SAMN02910384_02514 [Pseudobutyrivibrio sp. ACV-2]
MSENTINLRKNPSRKECEKIIKKILITEVLERGTNQHFKTASDFMNYFQSLYPASDSLTKQVQRAVKALQMPKDERGYFIINKTEAQLNQDKEIAFIMKKTNASLEPFSEYETMFLKCDGAYKDYLYQLLTESETFADKIITMINSSNGIILFTNNKHQLEIMVNSLINR